MNAVLRSGRDIDKVYGLLDESESEMDSDYVKLSKLPSSSSSLEINKDTDSMYITLPLKQFKDLVKAQGFDKKSFVEAFNLSLLVSDFSWSNKSVLTVKAMIGQQSVTDIVDTGSTGVVGSQGCVSRLNLVPDAEVMLSITLLTQTIKSLGKFFIICLSKLVSQ